MSGPAAHIADAARMAAVGWRDLLALGQRSSWGPLVVAFSVGAYDAERSVTPALVVGILYLSLPFGLLRHGFAALEADGAPLAMSPDAVRLAIAATNLPFLLVIVLLGGPVVGVAALGMVAIAWLLADRRVALADRPGLDVAAVGALPALAALMGLALADRPAADLPWLAIGAIFLWATGLATLTSIGEPAGGTSELRGTSEALGPRGTAWLALADLGMAVVLTALLGPLGVLAAVGVAAYLLLPPMVLATTAGAATAAARAAVSELPGLHLLVGSWIGILLLQHWGVVDWRPFAVVVVGATALAGYALANVLAIRLATHRRTVPPDDDRAPSVAIIVPCLDAAVHLPTSLAALRAQTYADFTILVVDHGSTDGSVDEAGAWLGEDGVIVAPPAPDGWAGKAWATHVGIERTSSDLVLVIDADTALVPVGLRHLVEQFEARGVDLLSGIPRFAMPTTGERAGVPGFAMLLVGFLPIWWSALSGGRPSATAFAFGRLLLVRREAYVATGGLSATPGTTRDGWALAHTLARAGRRLATVHLADLASSRPARDVDDTVAAWRRITGAPDVPLAATIAALLLQIGAYVLPLVAAPAALLGDRDLTAIGLALVPLSVLILMRLALALTQREPLPSILWHPVTVLVSLVGQAAGLRDHVVRRGT